jgi:glycosyltransferase involved in cell wall biosynthesis
VSLDILLLSLGSTHGLVIGDTQLAGMLEQAGASVAVAGVRIGAGDRLRRGYPANDLIEALAARRALASALARERPRAVIFSTTTASLLARVPTGLPYGIWLDSPARLNRPGPQNAVLHRLERRRMAQAAVVMPWSTPAVETLPAVVRNAVVISPPIHVGPTPGPERQPVVVAYTPDPKAKDLELVCRSWQAYLELERDPRAATVPGARLVITGIEPGWAAEFLRRRGILELPPRLELAGMVSRAQFAGLLASAAVFLSAARWEDFGQAPLEALAAGAALVLAPGGGPFPALALARELEPSLVAADRRPRTVAATLAAGVSAGLSDDALTRYRSEARAALAAYARAATVARLGDEVLPRLLG